MTSVGCAELVATVDKLGGDVVDALGAGGGGIELDLEDFVVVVLTVVVVALVVVVVKGLPPLFAKQ